MRTLNNIKNENPALIPEGIVNLQQESNIFILGTDYLEPLTAELKEFFIKYEGIIKSPVDCGNDNIQKYDCLEYDSAIRKKDLVVIAAFLWSKNAEYLRTLCGLENIRSIYIMEGAEYAFSLMYLPQRQLFKHPKIHFVDSYFRGIWRRKLTYDYFIENRSDFEQTYQWLSDDLSKETMVCYLDGHINVRTFPMAPVRDKSPQYYASDIIRLSDDEVYVDCGGWDGDTVNRFLRHSGQKYKKIYVFEPDTTMIPKLKSNIDSSVDYILIEKGAYNTNGSASFDNTGCGMITDDDDQNTIKVARIDDVIDDEITFIKMDIEGAEIPALEGGKKLLEKSLPKMAICAYHKRDDLITIPKFIKSLSRDYRLYLRAYHDYVSEVVLYAVRQ